jgi:hypothetical protein
MPERCASCNRLCTSWTEVDDLLLDAEEVARLDVAIEALCAGQVVHTARFLAIWRALGGGEQLADDVDVWEAAHAEGAS